MIGAILVGAALSSSGAAYQGLFRNPLVSPDILGVAAGAALGAVLGIFLSLPVIGIEALSFAGGLVAVTSVHAVAAGINHRDPILVLVLTGVVIGALLGSGVALLQYLPIRSTSFRRSPFGFSASFPPRSTAPIFGCWRRR